MAQVERPTWELFMMQSFGDFVPVYVNQKNGGCQIPLILFFLIPNALAPHPGY